MEKQKKYRFNLCFDESDEDHRRVSDFLNGCGRKKARYIVKAVLAYWALQEGQVQAVAQKVDKREGSCEQKSGNSDNRVINLDDDFKIDLEEAELMKQNYSIFDEIE